MNKAELIEEVAAKVGLSKRQVNMVVDALTSTITKSLARKEKVTLVGFGTFQVMERKTRRGVNPLTGARLSVPAKDSPKFEPGKRLRDAVI